MSMFELSEAALTKLYEKTESVKPVMRYYSPECPGGRCGNNCSGTCAWSPCTNLCAATSH